LTLVTNALEVKPDDAFVFLNYARIEGALSVLLALSKWKQPPLQLYGISLLPNSEVSIRGGVNLSKDKDLIYRPRVQAYDWRLEPPCKVDIDQRLINTGIVDWSSVHIEVPKGVILTFEPHGGEITN
jgi:hypothetical protein